MKMTIYKKDNTQFEVDTQDGDVVVISELRQEDVEILFYLVRTEKGIAKIGRMTEYLEER